MRPKDIGLYRFANEHDACGVGLVADLNNVADHRIVELGVKVLERLMHRGASGGDSETGDGAGILLAIPDKFFRKHIAGLPEFGKYAVAMVFGGDIPQITAQIEANGLELIAVRQVPVFPEKIGRAARESCPEIRQFFVKATNLDDRALERQIFIARRQIEKAMPELAIASFSRTSIVYKGLLQAPQLRKFYPDLNDKDFASPLALVHQRYSTNTFPTWELSQPFRYLGHNGEINTIKGNLNHLHTREALLKSDFFGPELSKCLPLMDGRESDSAALDRMLELLVLSGRSLPHAMLMLMPQPWGAKYHIGKDVRAFFEYHSALMEPWDGPAAVAFSDGVNAGAMLDRNGLRPARWTLTQDNLFVLASETGVVDIPPAEVVRQGRLKPGEMIWCDLTGHRLIFDREIKETLARSQPYRRWNEENRISIHGLFDSIVPAKSPAELDGKRQRFHWSAEDVERIVKPMAETGYEPIGSMGNDSALAVLSHQKPLLYNYFKQLFAQVTNPPIDPIREELVMSLVTYIGNHGNILAETPNHARIIKLPRPILTEEDIRRLSHADIPGFEATTLSLGWTEDLSAALDNLARQAVELVKSGKYILILSDRNLPDEQLPIPALLALGAVNQALTEENLRPPVGLIIQSGEVREVMHYALLLGMGATAIHPYLALETVNELSLNKDPVKAAENYIHAVDKGLLKTMSKMGISTLRSYRGAKLFEAIGLDQSLIQRFFPGVSSRIGGLTLKDIEAELKNRQAVITGGDYAYRRNGEQHLWTPQTLSLFRQAVQLNLPEKYQEYAKLINEQGEKACTIRGLFQFKKTDAIPLDEVESVENILHHFVSGAMSLGSLSPEAHEAIAIAMNRIGAMSNCGEGGEDPERALPGPGGENRASAIRQIASGRFGVTIDYLAHAKELQIKMAQGAKPGEGGQLPGHKVNADIARVRHSTPGVTLISPPPHHDIYSIEDLAQLISDLRSSNKDARISVKLVSEVGVGTIAAGVAKAAADVILISGYDGGTGASPLSSIKHAGLPWELGLAEAQQTLVLNNLRSRVKLQLDGQLKTGRDVVIGALLGAEEFGFATTLLVSLGCIMMRKCHDNSCPVGIATQDPELRKCFKGKPEYIENFLRLLAGEVREILASLGLRSLREAVGRTDLLEKRQMLEFFKLKNLDFSQIFAMAPGNAIAFQASPKHEPNFDQRHILPHFNGGKLELELPIANTDRSCGTSLSGEIAKRFGQAGMPEDSVILRLHGCAGQSFGAFLAAGVTIFLNGIANDFVGKGLSGGKIVIKPDAAATFNPSDNVIAGNVVGYGATSGQIFLCGQAGERFAIRNSGMTLVLEGGGDHGCEYMTGGRVVVLGDVGINFGAGMSGGVAYVYDRRGDFDLRCNLDTVDLDILDAGSEAELLSLIKTHLQLTGSLSAKNLLANWPEERSKFIKVFPVEYKKILQGK